MTDKEKLDKMKKLADAMYYAAQNLTTDASRLHKAMEEYHQFIINDYCKKEPACDNSEQATEKAKNWFESIADECDKLTSGNVAHLRAQIN